MPAGSTVVLPLAASPPLPSLPLIHIRGYQKLPLVRLWVPFFVFTLAPGSPGRQGIRAESKEGERWGTSAELQRDLLLQVRKKKKRCQ